MIDADGLSDASLAYRRDVRDVLAALGSDGQQGLSDAEARLRLARFGPNALAAEPAVPLWRTFLAQFQNVLVMLLLVAAIVSAVLSIGVRRMARRQAIVRHLAAVETLGSATVIASDKTGTLTKNEMTVRVVATASGRVLFEGSGYQPSGAIRREDGGSLEGPLRVELERALAVAHRANNAVLEAREGRWLVQGDPTEGALLVAAGKAGLESESLDRRLPRIGEIPFSAERRLMSTIHRDAEHGGRGVVFTKGAPDILLARCTSELVANEPRPLTPARRAQILDANDALAGQALRVLGVAERKLAPEELAEQARHPDARLEEDLVFIGLIGLIDPPRPEARAAVARARHAGIRPIMITGDQPRTAIVIANELGLADAARVLTGAEIARLSPDQLRAHAKDISVYARVSPEHKLQIVDALKGTGAVVAMTGDGVNDAPALKRADIGIAMGITGTDVSKEAADIVLADDNFASIVAAVEEGRAIFANIRKFLRYLLSSNMLQRAFGTVPLSARDWLGCAAVASSVLWLRELSKRIAAKFPRAPAKSDLAPHRFADI